MQESIKNYLIPISIFYMIVIVVLMLITYFNAISTLDLNRIDDFEEKISLYKKEVNEIEDNTCKNYLNDLISFVEKVNYDKKVKINQLFKDTYLNEDYILSYYLKGVNSCSKLTNEEAKEYNLPDLFMNANLTNDRIIQKYFFQYELNIKDRLVENIMIPSDTAANYYNKQKIELMIIDNIIKIVKEDVNNEN